MTTARQAGTVVDNARPQGKTATLEYLEMDLEKEKSGQRAYRYSWRKMETAA